jgi:hypothetical protein
MINAKETDKRLREAIIDILCYSAVFDTALSDEEILWYIPVKASQVGVRSHLEKLLKRGKIKRLKNKKYGLVSISYKSQAVRQKQVAQRLEKAQKWSRLFRFLPFVKSILVSSDDLFYTKKPSSNSHYIFITLPNRIYITKACLYYALELIGKRRNTKNQKDSIFLDNFYTTAGLKFEGKMGNSSQAQVMWFMLAQPVYGKDVWLNILKNNPLIYKSLPNYPWKHQNTKILTGFSRRLDSLDNLGYRRHLRHIADKPSLQSKTALLRIRPDTLIARPSHSQKLDEIKSRYSQIRSAI